MSGILVVGAGLAGAVYARCLAEAGYSVTVIDRRAHAGGNLHDAVDANGVRVHLYGPHLFHTKMAHTAAWFRRFGRFVPYEHKVRARLADGQAVPLPINIETLNTVLGVSLASRAEAEACLRAVAEPIESPANAAEYLASRIGTRLTDLFFRPYTKKMWSLDLEDMAAAVVRRIPLHLDHNETYFDPSETQMLPEHGYSAVFDAIYDHPGIALRLETAFEHGMLDRFAYCFNAMPIDEFYGYRFGELPYRSIRFHHRTEATPAPQGWSVTNFTDTGPYTRETAWHLLPCHRPLDTGRVTITREEPCDYRDNGFERYYPVKTSDDRYGAIYRQYQALAESKADRIQFIGRCGTYQYLDMDQVINQSLTRVRAWIAERAG